LNREVFATDSAPAAIGPYSQAISWNNLVFTSGQIPLDPASGAMVDGDIEAQTRRVLDNLGAVLREAGAGFDSLLRTTIFLVDLGHFGDVNRIYGEYVPQPFPSRSTVQVAALPRGALIEIDAIAVRR
jgi:2-iminobutanoate/2-iminopropanoate deaminase